MDHETRPINRLLRRSYVHRRQKLADVNLNLVRYGPKTDVLLQNYRPILGLSWAYPGRTVAAKVADQSRKNSRKVAESRGRSQNKEEQNRSFTIISNVFDKVARQRRKPKSRKIAEGRIKSRNVARNRGDREATVPSGPGLGLIIIEDRLIKLGFTHVRDLLSTQLTDVWFMSHAEAESRTGSTVLANAIMKKIFSLPVNWGLIMHNKVREPFCTGDWFIIDSNEPTPDSPFQIFETTFVLENHLVGESFRFSNSQTNLLIKSTISVNILPISQCIKANVFHLHEIFFYCGNYLISELLSSRISWQCNDIQKIVVFDFSISSIYKAILFKKDKTIPALLRWERILSFSTSSSWKSMLKYLHDPILGKNLLSSFACWKQRGEIWICNNMFFLPTD
jgi:hypothetical protein